MAHPDSDEHVRRQLRTLQRVVGNPTDAVLARRSGVAPATFSEVMSGKRRPREEFVTKVISGCLMSARAHGHAPLDEQRILHALRLPGHTATDSGILERDDDLSRCSAALDRGRTRAGAIVVIEGAAGIGKSELLTRLCAESAVRGIVPLGVRGNQRDQTVAFGGVRTLLARWIAGRSPREQQKLFHGAAAFARAPLGISTTQRGAPGAVIGLIEAVYWLVVNATNLVGAGQQDEALLFAVDDAHWLDEESLNWLEFLSDRLTGLPVLLVLAYRPYEPAPTSALMRIALRATEVVRPQPLSHDAVRTIVSRSLGRQRNVEDPDETFCSAFLQHSGGNPFYLRWMLNLARDRRLEPTSAAAEEVGRLTPRQVVVYLNERLTGLGPAAQRLAQTLAVLGPGSSLERATQLAGLTAEEGKYEYDRLCQAAILTDEPAVDFCHPIIRGAVYDDIAPSLRSDIHLAAARLLRDADTGSDAVAVHLLQVRAAANPWVTDELCAAAGKAMAAGLSGTAARYLKRAVDEPPPPAQLCRVRLRHGQALALGEMAAALPELVAAYQQAPDDVLRTEAAIALAKTYGYANQLGNSVRLLDTAIARCEDSGARDQLTTEQLLWATWWADDPRRLDRMRLLDRIAPPLAGTTHVQRLLITMQAWSLVLRGEPRATALAAIGPVVRHGVAFADVDQGMEVATMTAFIHMYSDEVTVAGDLFTQAVREFDRDGWRGTHLAFAHTHLGNVALRQGRLADAVADADIALRLADRTGTGTPAEWFATGTLIEALTARGDVDRAAAVCANRNYAGPQPDALVLPIPQAVAGTLQLARHELPRAVATLRRTGSWLERAHLPNPSLCSWRFDLARALKHSAPDEAQEIAATGLQQADRFGSPTVRGLAMRTLAALHPESAVELLTESVRVLHDSPNRLEYARALAALGAALIQAGHPGDAGQPLTDALALADECDAPLLRVTVTQRLGSIGTTVDLRPRRANVLQPRQRRVAQLAAAGRSEAEIAYSMVLSLETVTTLLREAREKLAARSLAELRSALA
jgi:DNA-binding CsgD family transcriptional regulator